MIKSLFKEINYIISLLKDIKLILINDKYFFYNLLFVKFLLIVCKIDVLGLSTQKYLLYLIDHFFSYI